MADRLYLSNCTAQKLDFYYRIQFLDPEQTVTTAARRGVRPINLAVGEHNKIVSVPDGALMSIEPQLLSFGFIPSEAVNASSMRTMGVILGVFSKNRISDNARMTVIMHNRGVRTEEGRKRRQDAAIANTDHLLETLRNAGMPESGLPPAMVVEYEQDVSSEQDDRGRLTEGIIVRPDARPPKAPPRPRASRAAQARAARNGA
jgi:hypothetical protein